MDGNIQTHQIATHGLHRFPDASLSPRNQRILTILRAWPRFWHAVASLLLDGQGWQMKLKVLWYYSHAQWSRFCSLFQRGYEKLQNAKIINRWEEDGQSEHILSTAVHRGMLAMLALAFNDGSYLWLKAHIQHTVSLLQSKQARYSVNPKDDQRCLHYKHPWFWPHPGCNTWPWKPMVRHRPTISLAMHLARLEWHATGSNPIDI